MTKIMTALLLIYIVNIATYITWRLMNPEKKGILDFANSFKLAGNFENVTIAFIYGSVAIAIFNLLDV